MQNNIPMRKLLFVMLLATAFLPACKSNNSKVSAEDKDNYEKGKLTLEQIEKKDPVQFLMVTGKDKRNLLGQTVIKGTITSRAKIVSYKDIDIKLSFFSKTGALLEEDHEIVYETIGPGNSSDFKSKYFAPKGSDSVALKVVGARLLE
jgi:hypothetical protein